VIDFVNSVASFSRLASHWSQFGLEPRIFHDGSTTRIVCPVSSHIRNLTLRAVQYAFVQLFEAGLIYRATRLVHWCPLLQSVISDIEVDRVEVEANSILKIPKRRENEEKQSVHAGQNRKTENGSYSMYSFAISFMSCFTYICKLLLYLFIFV
jgi:hypothetical protein